METPPRTSLQTFKRENPNQRSSSTLLFSPFLSFLGISVCFHAQKLLVRNLR
ncbi:hypothetical protein RchiOBHm_Chr5g0059611 [Rosa chinensis]|uniref:Uncharacterized protein n=1 Tax=Rosa chinensis TaxID=74649 RepID=A0A2P6QHG8_ROSCH|nr:hypothetical protein RchiOBHm_Chr5g0059611 [Rosa chinensis]